MSQQEDARRKMLEKIALLEDGASELQVRDIDFANADDDSDDDHNIIRSVALRQIVFLSESDGFVQPRADSHYSFEDEGMLQLRESIIANGILQPPVGVCVGNKDGDPVYALNDGRRRFYILKKISEERGEDPDLALMPIYIRQHESPFVMSLNAMAANEVRSGTSVVEKAIWLLKVLRCNVEEGISHKDIYTKAGISRTNFFRLKGIADVLAPFIDSADFDADVLVDKLDHIVVNQWEDIVSYWKGCDENKQMVNEYISSLLRGDGEVQDYRLRSESSVKERQLLVKRQFGSAYLSVRKGSNRAKIIIDVKDISSSEELSDFFRAVQRKVVG